MSKRGWILFAAMGVIWGIPYLLIKVAVEDLSPACLVFLKLAECFWIEKFGMRVKSAEHAIDGSINCLIRIDGCCVIVFDRIQELGKQYQRRLVFRRVGFGRSPGLGVHRAACPG